jgi:hypothetical protein
VDNLTLPVQVLPAIRVNSNRLLASIVSLEKFEGVATSHYPRALVMEQRRWVALKNDGVMAERFESDACG